LQRAFLSKENKINILAKNTKILKVKKFLNFHLRKKKNILSFAKIPISNILLKLVSSISFKDYGNYHVITMVKISISKNIAPSNGFNS
jgi:hypothetical protein